MQISQQNLKLMSDYYGVSPDKMAEILSRTPKEQIDKAIKYVKDQWEE